MGIGVNFFQVVDAYVFVEAPERFASTSRWWQRRKSSTTSSRLIFRRT